MVDEDFDYQQASLPTLVKIMSLIAYAYMARPSRQSDPGTNGSE